MLSAWSQPPCSALTGSFVKGYSLSFPTLLKCVLPVCICGLSSLLKWNFLPHLIKQWNICWWKVVPPSAYGWTRRGSLSRLPLIYLSMEAFQTLLMQRSVWPCFIWTAALQNGLRVRHQRWTWERCSLPYSGSGWWKQRLKNLVPVPMWMQFQPLRKCSSFVWMSTAALDVTLVFQPSISVTLKICVFPSNFAPTTSDWHCTEMQNNNPLITWVLPVLGFICSGCESPECLVITAFDLGNNVFTVALLRAQRQCSFNPQCILVESHYTKTTRVLVWRGGVRIRVCVRAFGM